MAIVKFVSSGCPMNNIISYITRDEATEEKLIDGLYCSADSAVAEFNFVKNQFHKKDGRMYYHIVQSFSPDDEITPETAHEIGMEFAQYFGDFQCVVATHINKEHIHNHIVMNSVNFNNGRKFHQTADEMLMAKEYSNKLCQERGVSVTEVKSRYSDNPVWKRRLREHAFQAMCYTDTKEGFIEYMQCHGYKVKWEDNLKHITFTTPDGHKCRDNKLYDERFLKDNLEMYYALGGCESIIGQEIMYYQTPPHESNASYTATNGLVSMVGDLLSIAPPKQDYIPRYTKAMSQSEKRELEKYLGKRISLDALAYYSSEDEPEQGMDMMFY